MSRLGTCLRLVIATSFLCMLPQSVFGQETMEVPEDQPWEPIDVDAILAKGMPFDLKEEFEGTVKVGAPEAPLVEFLRVAYKSQTGTNISYIHVGLFDGFSRLAKREFDYLGHGVSDLAPFRKLVPNMVTMVMGGEALVIGYNLPGFPAEHDLILDRDALHGIFFGNLTFWDDVRIAHLNPGFQFPHESIRGITLNRPETFLFVGAVSALFNGTRPVSTAKWPPNFTVMGPQTDLAEAGAAVSGTPYSMSFQALHTTHKSPCNKYQRIARIINKAGKAVTPNAQSIQSAMASAVKLGMITEENPATYIWDMPGSNDYPMAFMAYLSIQGQWNSTKIGNTSMAERPRRAEVCRHLYEVLRFMDWQTTSEESTALSVGLGYVIPDKTLHPLIERALLNVTCDGYQVYAPLYAKKQVHLVEHKSVNPVAAISIVVLSGIAITTIAGLLFANYYLRQHRVMKASSPLFLALILIGAIICIVPIILESFEPTNGLCMAIPITRYEGFGLMYGAIFLKTWRVSRIFNVSWMIHHNQKLLQDSRLLIRLGIMITLMTVYLAVWIAADRPQVELKLTNGGRTSMTVCEQSWWEMGLQIAEIVMLLGAAYLAFMSRRAPQAFNEAKWLGIAIYNWTIILFVGLLMYHFAFNDPTTSYITLSVARLIAIMGVVFLMMLPKFYAIKTNAQVTTLQVVKKDGKNGGRGSLLSTDGGDGAVDVEETSHHGHCGRCKLYEEELKNLRDEITRLRERLLFVSNPHTLLPTAPKDAMTSSKQNVLTSLSSTALLGNHGEQSAATVQRSPTISF